jgi:hypothetical protein
VAFNSGFTVTLLAILTVRLILIKVESDPLLITPSITKKLLGVLVAGGTYAFLQLATTKINNIGSRSFLFSIRIYSSFKPVYFSGNEHFAYGMVNSNLWYF